MSTRLEDEPGGFGHVFEPAIASIKKAGVWTAQRTDDQVQLAVAVDVGKNRAARGLVCASNTSARSDIFELAVSEIAVECVGAIQIAEVQIAQSIAIEITGGDPGP